MHRIEGLNFIRDSLGRNVFTDGPPGTTVPAAWLNSLQEEIAYVIEQADLQLKGASNDTQTQLFEAIVRIGSTGGWDYVVTSQATFNDMIERVSANRYKIKDDYRSVYCKYIAAGYQMSGPNSPLSNGDTWGYIETNNCSLLFCEGGTAIDFGLSKGYIKINTADAIINGVINTSDITTGDDISYGFLMDAVALNAKLINCSVKNKKILSNGANFAAFKGVGTPSIDKTISYTNCSVEDIEYVAPVAIGISTYGFKDCQNLVNCFIEDIIIGVNLEAAYHGFDTCLKLTNCYVEDVTNNDTTGNTSVFGFWTCKGLSSCRVDDLNGPQSGSMSAFRLCEDLSSCIAENCDSVSSTYGFDTCFRLSSCTANDIDSSGSTPAGFKSCNVLSACYANKIDYSGAGVLDAYGFESCRSLAACEANDVDVGGAGSAEGFKSCTYGAALYTNEAVNSGNDWIDTVDVSVTNKVSTPSNWT
jgi:hypothetical protein